MEEDENAVPADLKPADFSTKILQLDGFRVELGSVEHPVESSTTGTTVWHTARENLTACVSKGSVAVEDPGFEDLQGIPIASASGQVVVRATIKHTDSLPGPRLDVEMFVGAVHVLLSPQQLHSLLEMIAEMSAEGMCVCVVCTHGWSYPLISFMQLLVGSLRGLE